MFKFFGPLKLFEASENFALGINENLPLKLIDRLLSLADSSCVLQIVLCVFSLSTSMGANL